MKKSTKIILGSGVYAVSVYLFYSYSKRRLQSETALLQTSSFKTTYDRIAHQYDDTIEREEEISSVLKLREKVGAMVSGDTLEVCCGTGRMLKYIKEDQVKSLTMVDSSFNMVSVAKVKLSLEPKRNARVVTMDAAKLDFPNGSFDTVIQTFGICSYEQPIGILCIFLKKYLIYV